MHYLKRAMTQKTSMNDMILESEVAEQAGLPIAEVREHRNGKLRPADYTRVERRVYWTKNAAAAFLTREGLPDDVPAEKTPAAPIPHAPAPIREWVVRRAHPQIRNTTVIEVVPYGANWKNSADITLVRIRPGTRFRPGDRVLASPFNGRLWKYMGRPKSGITYETSQQS
jgi:hypothetical protein